MSGVVTGPFDRVQHHARSHLGFHLQRFPRPRPADSLLGLRTIHNLILTLEHYVLAH